MQGYEGRIRAFSAKIDEEAARRLSEAKKHKPIELGEKSDEELVTWAVMFATENLGEFAEYVKEE